jgi:hypothetical protein
MAIALLLCERQFFRSHHFVVVELSKYLFICQIERVGLLPLVRICLHQRSTTSPFHGVTFKDDSTSTPSARGTADFFTATWVALAGTARRKWSASASA